LVGSLSNNVPFDPDSCDISPKSFTGTISRHENIIESPPSFDGQGHFLFLIHFFAFAFLLYPFANTTFASI